MDEIDEVRARARARANGAVRLLFNRLAVDLYDWFIMREKYYFMVDLYGLKSAK